ncbi:hypothetical protein [Trueperella bialowiezensis]|uniref:Uncharacterized protein n=1 Tax=Trueperella bialowiezensis TaxID=312285 RepID=A0A3S4WGU3_9ACTO|nr:hypothetical protein [Trueperella bialowiezensis]VEI13600.1 Uncharacterised protein [Trueperella bialowiezensis]
MTKPRRPAQLKPEQIELIEGGADTAATSELANTSAQAIVPLGVERREDDDVIARVLELIREEGIDVIAESWVDSPEDSLPGTLWRGFLLAEWVRRYPDEVELRFAAAKQAAQEHDPEKIDQVLTPREVRAKWDEVLKGDFRGDFADVLRTSARFTDFIGRVQPGWIGDDEHPLATEVTRRDTAMLRVSKDFQAAGERLVKGMLG